MFVQTLKHILTIQLHSPKVDQFEPDKAIHHWNQSSTARRPDLPEHSLQSVSSAVTADQLTLNNLNTEKNMDIDSQPEVNKDVCDYGDSEYTSHRNLSQINRKLIALQLTVLNIFSTRCFCSCVYVHCLEKYG